MSDKECMAVSIDEACYMTSLSRATIYRRIEDGLLEAVKVGHRNLILMASIKRLLRSDREAA